MPGKYRRRLAVPADPAGELDVLHLDCDAFRVNGTEGSVRKAILRGKDANCGRSHFRSPLSTTHNQVGLGDFLKRQDRRRRELQVSLVFLGDFTDKPLKCELADEQLRRLLIASNLAECDRAGAVAVGPLHASHCWGGLATRFCGEMFSR